MANKDNMDQDLEGLSNQVVLEDGDTEGDQKYSPLIGDITSKFTRSKKFRYQTEQRWLDAYLSFRGLYGDEVAFTESEKSRVFIKITKTKVMAAYGQILDIMFADGKFPLSIESSVVPEDVEESVHIDANTPDKYKEPAGDILGFEGDGRDLQPGDTLSSRLGSAVKSMFNIESADKGESLALTQRTIHPAEIAARKMQDTIEDQFEESNTLAQMGQTILEKVILGTGVLKGPFGVRKEYPKWDAEGKYTPKVAFVPITEHVTIWDIYPDDNARTVADLQWNIQRHRMSVSDILALKNRVGFRKTVIDELAEAEPNWVSEWWESSLEEQSFTENRERFEVLEYWGMASKDFIENDLDEDIPEELQSQDELQINAWISGGKLLKLVLNPFKPARIPYHITFYEEDPYNFFGVGLPENMSDAQVMMNGFARLAIDNAVLSANVMLEVDETNLVPGQSFDLYAGKIWRRAGGAPGQAVFATTFPSTAPQNLQMFDKFRQIADDATGIPSFSHGQTGVTGVGRTASGISMLLNAASVNIKTVVRNLDRMIKSLGESFFAFNMQFNFDPDIKGDLSVKATGTASLLQKEVETQRLLQFMQIAGSTPIANTIVNYEEILRRLANTLGLDEDRLLLDPKNAAIQAALLQQINQPQGPEVAGSDDTGGGGQTIGPGVPQVPGNDAFTGTPQATESIS